MARQILVGEVRSGRRITQIPVSACSWSVKHRGTGEISIDIPLDAEEFNVLERQWVGGKFFGDGSVIGPDTVPVPSTPLWRPGDGLRPEFLASLEPVRCFLAVVEGDRVIEAGPIWTWDYAVDGVLTVRAKGMRSLFEHRYLIGPAAEWPDGNPARWERTYSNLSLGTIAKRLVQLTMSLTGGELPIVLPADEASTNTRTYRGSDLAAILGRLDDLASVIGGPDIALEPRLTADRMGLEWVMRTGTAADPLLHQVGGDWVWDSRVPRGGVSGISVSRDGTGLAQEAWVTGAGADDALLMARSTAGQVGAFDLRELGYPLMQTADSRPTVEQQATLDRWAQGNLTTALRPWQTWKISVLATSTTDDGVPVGPQVGQYRPGDWAKVWVPRTHPLLGLLLQQGFHRTRLLNISGDLDDFVNLELAPQMEAR